MSDEFFRKTFGDTESVQLGSGWVSGVSAVFLGLLGLGAVPGALAVINRNPVAIVLRSTGLITIEVPWVVVGVIGIFRFELWSGNAELVPAFPVVPGYQRFTVRNDVAQFHARVPGESSGFGNIAA